MLSFFLVLIILAAFAALVLWLGFKLKFFQLVKVDEPEQDDGDSGSQPDSDYKEIPQFGHLEGQEHDAPHSEATERDFSSNDYFSEEEEPVEEEAPPAPPEQPKDQEEGVELTFDKLSNFKTGRSFFVGCQKELTEGKEQGVTFAMLCFDFDRFRYLNSLRGQSIGDYAITRISQEMENIFPRESHFTRISADHFLALFPSPLENDVLESYADQLRRISDRIKEDMAIKSGLRISVGAAFTLEPRDFDAMLLMQRADVARHCTKASKDVIWSLFTQSMVESGFYGESALDDYKENQYDDEISLYFQPIADLVKGQLTACDVLVRWSCDDENYRDVLITPESGRIPTNNRKVVYQCCRWMSRWYKAGKSVMATFVWIPATDFYKEDFDAFLGQCFHDFQINTATLVIQVDMSVVRLDRDAAIRQFQKLRDIGVKTAVRGIDRSYATLETFEGLPLDYVIFHRSISDSVEKNQERVEQAKRLASEAAGMKMISVFEGVNNQEQANILKRLGATMVQGRYAGSYTTPEDYGRSLNEYAVKSSHHSGTTILDDSALSKGDFHVY